MNAVDELLGRRVGTRSIGLVRILVGAVAVVHLWSITAPALRGVTYHDHFHHPYVRWYPELGPGAYTALLGAGTMTAVAMSLGVATRLTTAITAGVVTHHLFLSTTHVHNNRAYLCAVLVLLAMAPCGRSLSVDAWLARRRSRPLVVTMPAWPLWLLRFECALVYGASGTSKLVDPDWFGGTVTWGRVVAQETLVRASVLPDWVADVLVDRSVHTLLAKGIVATELFIAGGLWWQPTRRFAVATAVVFHVLIEFSARVEVFSYLGIAMLFVWADPELPRRTGPVRQDRRMPDEPAAAVSVGVMTPPMTLP